jgi:hypothetical protein
MSPMLVERPCARKPPKGYGSTPHRIAVRARHEPAHTYPRIVRDRSEEPASLAVPLEVLGAAVVQVRANFILPSASYSMPGQTTQRSTVHASGRSTSCSLRTSLRRNGSRLGRGVDAGTQLNGHGHSQETLQSRSPLPDSNRRPLPYHGSQGTQRAGTNAYRSPSFLGVYSAASARAC